MRTKDLLIFIRQVECNHSFTQHDGPGFDWCRLCGTVAGSKNDFKVSQFKLMLGK